MVLKNKLSIVLAVVLMTGVLFASSQSVFAFDTPDCSTCMNEDDYTGTMVLDEYRIGCHKILVHPCCTNCVETLECLGVDLDSKKVKFTADDDFEIKRAPFGSYNLYFTGSNLKKDFMYTNSLLLQTLLKKQFVLKVEGFKVKDIED